MNILVLSHTANTDSPRQPCRHRKAHKRKKVRNRNARGSPGLPSLRCSSAESPPAALASAGGFSQVSPLPGPPWCAPRCAPLWVCGHVCVRWASSLSRPAWQQAFTRPRACVCMEQSSVRPWGVCLCMGSATTNTTPMGLSPPLFPLVLKLFPFFLSQLLLHKAAGECMKVCEREREHALSLLSAVEPPAPPPTLALFSRGLNQVTGLMWRYGCY